MRVIAAPNLRYLEFCADIARNSTPLERRGQSGKLRILSLIPTLGYDLLRRWRARWEPRPLGLSITHKLSSNHDPQLNIDKTG